jgi:Tol biopolymer transport system component
LIFFNNLEQAMKLKPIYCLLLICNLAIQQVSCIPTGEGFNELSRPNFSPDGRALVFSYTLHGFTDIYVYNLQKNELKQITRSVSKKISYSQPTFSQDGSKIAFVRYANSAGCLYFINADGSDQKRLTNNKYNDAYPFFSPDGKQVAFARAHVYRPTSTGGYAWSDWEIYTLSLDNNKEQKVTAENYYLLCCVSFSPDARGILYTAISKTVHEPSSQVYLVNVNDEHPPTLLIEQNAFFKTYPVFSRNQNKIAFSSLVKSPEWRYSSSHDSYEVFTMDLMSKKTEQVTKNGLRNISPAFSPDGRSLIFLSSPIKETKFSLMRVNLDGSGLQPVPIFHKEAD